MVHETQVKLTAFEIFVHLICEFPGFIVRINCQFIQMLIINSMYLFKLL